MFEIEVKQQTGLITWNHEALKKELSERLQRYQGLVVTEDAIKEAKDTRASLNKVTKAIDDERKRIKKLYCGPLEIFENQAKELTGLVTNIIGEIDVQIKSFEQQAKDAKREAIESYFAELRFYLVGLDKLWDEKWLNSTVSDKQWKEQLSGKIETIKANIAIIDNYPEEDRAAVKTFYLDCLDLTQATTYQNQRKEREKALKAYEIERNQQTVQTPTVEKEVSPVPQNETTEDILVRRVGANVGTKELVGLIQFMVSNNIEFNFDDLDDIVATIKGTKQDIIAIGNYMNANGIRFRKVG